MKKLIDEFYKHGFNEIGYLSKDVNLLYKMSEDTACVVNHIDFTVRASIADADNGLENDSITYIKNVIEGCKEIISNTSITKYKIITVVETETLEDVNEIENEIDDCWIVDMENDRLMIFENQPLKFFGVEEVIESYLDMKRAGFPSFKAKPAHFDEDGNFYINNEVELVNEEYKKMELPKKTFRDFLTISNLIIIINFIVFVSVVPGHDNVALTLLNHGGFYAPYIEQGEYYRLFTANFLHFSWGHLLSNMFSLYIFGDILEKYWGKLRFTVLYILGGIGGSLMDLIYYQFSPSNHVGAGASGAICAVIGAVIVLALLDEELRKKCNPFVLTLVALLIILDGVFFTANVGNEAHIGGLLTGILFAFIVKNVSNWTDIKRGD